MAQIETIQQHFRTLRMPTAVQVVAETIATAHSKKAGRWKPSSA